MSIPDAILYVFREFNGIDSIKECDTPEEIQEKLVKILKEENLPDEVYKKVKGILKLVVRLNHVVNEDANPLH